MIWPSHKKGILVSIAAAGLLTASGAAYAAVDGASVDRPGAIHQLAGGGGPQRFARAYGLDPAKALAVFTLRNGQTVSVVGDSSARCLIRGSGGQTAETCDDISAINQGQAISVLDECGTEGRNLMEITGLAAEGVGVVRLIWSDGRTQDSVVTQGAFRFEGSNPAPGAPYPIGIAWISGGRNVGEATFPVHGDEFCLPAS